MTIVSKSLAVLLQHMKFLPLTLFFSVLVVSGCTNNGDSSNPQPSKKISATISGYSDGVRILTAKAYVIDGGRLMPLYRVGNGTISDIGEVALQLPDEITITPFLIPISIMKSYCAITSNPPELKISLLSISATSLTAYDTKFLVYSNEPSNSGYASYPTQLKTQIYADRDAKLTGECVTNAGSKRKISIDLSLKKGWNVSGSGFSLNERYEADGETSNVASTSNVKLRLIKAELPF